MTRPAVRGSARGAKATNVAARCASATSASTTPSSASPRPRGARRLLRNAGVCAEYARRAVPRRRRRRRGRRCAARGARRRPIVPRVPAIDRADRRALAPRIRPAAPSPRRPQHGLAAVGVHHDTATTTLGRIRAARAIRLAGRRRPRLRRLELRRASRAARLICSRRPHAPRRSRSIARRSAASGGAYPGLLAPRRPSASEGKRAGRAGAHGHEVMTMVVYIVDNCSKRSTRAPPSTRTGGCVQVCHDFSSTEMKVAGAGRRRRRCRAADRLGKLLPALAHAAPARGEAAAAVEGVRAARAHHRHGRRRRRSGRPRGPDRNHPQPRRW